MNAELENALAVKAPVLIVRALQARTVRSGLGVSHKGKPPSRSRQAKVRDPEKAL